MLAEAGQQEVPGSEAGSGHPSPDPQPLEAAREPQEGPACGSPQAGEEEARGSPQAGLESNTKAPSESLEPPAQKSDSGIDTKNKSANGAEKEIADKCPEAAAEEGQASQSGSEQARGQEHQHTQGAEPAADSPEPGAQETQGGEGSRSCTDDGDQQAGSSTGVSKGMELAGQAVPPGAPGAEEPCRAGPEAASPPGSQQPLRQESRHSTRRASRESSWQSLGPASQHSAQEGLGDKASWQLRGPSPLSVDSNERQELVRNITYQAEEGATWTSQRTHREVTNRSQQTSVMWSRKALAEILKSSTQKSESNINVENQLLKRAEKETSGKCSEKAAAEGQPTRQASRHSSQEVRAQGSRRGSQQAPQQQSLPGSQQPVRQGLQQPEEQREGSALVCNNRLTLELELDSGNLQGIELVVEENEQRHVFYIGLTDTAQQRCNIFSPSGEKLMCSIASKMIRSLGEQTSDTWMKMNQETVENTLLQCSSALLEDAQVTYNLTSLEGGMGSSNMGKILVITDEQTGDTVIQTIHETAQLPGSQQTQHSHEAGTEVLADIPKMCAEADAEMLQMMKYQSWDSGQVNRNTEMASGLLVACDGPRDVQNMALSREMVSEAQQTSSIISLGEGNWIKRKTGKLLKNNSQQTSVAALQESSATTLE